MSNQNSIPILKEGYLIKQGGLVKNWKRRWFVLEGCNLHYYENEDKSKFKDSISLLNCQITPYDNIKDKEYCIQIEGLGKRTYYLCASNAIEQKEWINALVKGSIWNPHLPDLSPTNEVEDSLTAVIKGMICQCCTEDIYRAIGDQFRKVKIDLDVENETLKVEGVFDRKKIINALEESGFFLYFDT